MAHRVHRAVEATEVAAAEGAGFPEVVAGLTESWGVLGESWGVGGGGVNILCTIHGPAVAILVSPVGFTEYSAKGCLGFCS